jgi:TrmH family RNA methyltransferase
MYKQITSLQNPIIKQLIKLQDKARERKKTGFFVIEGLREIGLAITGGYAIKTILFAPEIIEPHKLSDISTDKSISFIEITKEVYQKIAYRNSTEGIIAVAKLKDHSLTQLKIENKTPLILVAEAPEKPGNIGAILRTADAANVDAVLIANPSTDLYNPNIIRSSVGCVFTNQIAMGSTTEILSYLKDKDIAVFCAALKDNANIYHIQDFTKSTAIVVGTEATGLSNEWLQNSTQNIIIPMQGKIDSMNVSVAAGILIFEAVRQRNS